jgi:hypothetical protein
MPEWSGEGQLIHGSRCPRCQSELEYNGNYWCSRTECRYVMPGDPERMRRSDKDAFNVAYTLLMHQRGEEPKPEALYPPKKTGTAKG